MAINRTQQFIYFQNKAKHYDNLKKAKPKIQSFRRRTISPMEDPYRMSPYIAVMKQYNELRTNEALVNNILSIKKSKKTQIQVQGYTRYNNFSSAIQNNWKRGNYFREGQRYRSIRHQNEQLGKKILSAKPSIGTIADWSKRDSLNKSLRRLSSKHDNSQKQHKKHLSIYSSTNRNNFIPEHYKTFMGRDGSTVAIREKMFLIPKQIETNRINRQRKRSTIDFELDWNQQQKLNFQK